MLGADAGIVEAGGDRVRLDDLAVVVLQQVGAVAVQHARPARRSATRRARPVSRPWPAASTPIDPHARGRRGTGGTGRSRWSRRRRRRPARRAGGPPAPSICARASRADHRLEVAHHRRIGMRAGDGADEVVGVVDVGDPVAQRLVHRVLERARAGARPGRTSAPSSFMRKTLGCCRSTSTLAHVDDASQAEARADGGGGDAVLAGAGLGDDARLAHAPGEQDLADAVVDLVRAGVVELVALEVDLARRRDARSAARRSRAGSGGRRSASRVVAARPGTPGRAWPPRRPARARGSAASASRRRSGRRRCRRAALVGPVRGRCWAIVIATGSSSARRAAAHERLDPVRVLTPGRLSTPEDTSTIGASVSARASATFPASRPPASSHGQSRATPATSRQSKAGRSRRAAPRPGRLGVEQDRSATAA